MTMDEDLRNKIQAALKEAGAFCGECGWQPGDEGCADCKRHWNWCTDALLPVFQTERRTARVETLTEAKAAVESPQERAAVGGGLGWETARDVLHRMIQKAGA
jgi:hypothetical protein